MSEHQFAGTGGQASQGPFTWGGSGPRRVCDSDGRPYPAGNYGATVGAGMYMVTDAKYGTQQWVYAGEMVHWDGKLDPVQRGAAAGQGRHSGSGPAGWRGGVRHDTTESPR